MVRISGQILAATVLMVAGLSSAANGQSLQVSSPPQSAVGFTAGVSLDPEQGVVGVFWQSPEIGNRFHIRPGVEGGFGNDLKLATINIDFIARFPIGGSGWHFVQGGGPAVVIARFDAFRSSATDVGAGGSYIIGFAHDGGFLGEFRIGGGGNVPNLKLSAGYAIGW